MKNLKSMSKKILLAVLSVLMISGLALTLNGKVKAESNFPAEATVEIIDGASLKLNEQGGLRFVVKLNETAKKFIKDDDANDAVKLVAYIGPTALFEKTDEVIAANALKLVINEETVYEVDGAYYANVCVVSVKEANRKLSYTAKAFVYSGETVVATSALNANARGSFYDVATMALLDEQENYTQKILNLGSYSWLGASEDFPLFIDSVDLYNGLVAKINAGIDLSNKYVAIKTSVNVSEGTALAEGKTLPQNNYKVSRVTFKNGETELGYVLVKEGAAASIANPEIAADDTYRYTFEKWVTENGGETEADLSAITQDTTVYAKFSKILVNEITALTASNVKYGEEPVISASAKHGEATLTYSKSQDGNFVSWSELDNHDVGEYFVKAAVLATSEYEAAEKVVSFKVEKASNAITYNLPETIGCKETVETNASATFGTVTYGWAKIIENTFFESLDIVKYDKDGIVGNISYKVKAEVADTDNYAGASVEKTFKIAHNFVNGVCSDCNKEQTGIKYNTEGTVAYITGYSGNPSTEVYPVAEKDGKAVKYVGFEAFKDNKEITKVVLPASVDSLEGSAFLNCSNLEYVSMTGVATMNWASKYNNKDGDNNFRDCTNLKYVIIGSALSSNCGQFNAKVLPAELILNFYADGSSSAVNLQMDNALWTGNVFYKGDASKCFQWNEVNGEIKHGPTAHTFVDGICSVCGKYGDAITQGVVYGYDSASDCYYVGNNKTLNVSVVNILGTYDDGVNGTHSVKYIRNSAFLDNGNITKVTIHENIEQLDGSVFQNCAKLEYVSMVGVTDMAFLNLSGKGIYKGETEVITNNNFHLSKNIKYLIVNKNFNLFRDNADAQQFPGTDKCIDLYVDGAENESNIRVTGGNNGLLSGVVYYKGDASKCFQWNEVDGEIKHGPSAHTFVNGICSDCGAKDAMGVSYKYYNGSYYVAAYSGSAEVVNVFGTWNDGEHGEANVTFVANGAFKGNTSIKRVILHENITTLDGEVFNGCSNLEYVSMKGVTNLQLLNISNTKIYTGEYYTSNNFMNCGKLTVVVVGKNFNADPQMFKIWGDDSITACTDIYAEGAEGECNIVLSDEQNALLTKKVYYYSETQKSGCWHYDENGLVALWN